MALYCSFSHSRLWESRGIYPNRIPNSREWQRQCKQAAQQELAWHWWRDRANWLRWTPPEASGQPPLEPRLIPRHELCSTRLLSSAARETPARPDPTSGAEESHSHGAGLELINLASTQSQLRYLGIPGWVNLQLRQAAHRQRRIEHADTGCSTHLRLEGTLRQKQKKPSAHGTKQLP